MKNNYSPFDLFKDWYNEALKLPVTAPSAMVLATASKAGAASARVVLLKEWSETGFVFYTNYQSRKAREMEENPLGSLLFYWEQLSKQVRIEGKIERVSIAQSETYFQSRPRESQLAAWASKQSQLLSNRSDLENRFFEYKDKFPGKVPLPEFWGGYRLIPDKFEFWEDGDYRLHHRCVYKRHNNGWQSHLLNP